MRTARRAYVRALEGARAAEWRVELPGALPWWRREPDRPVAAAPPAAWVDEQGRSTGLERKAMSAEELLARACEILEVVPEGLSARGKGREASWLRYLVAALAVERWGVRVGAIGKLVGRRPEVVGRWVRRGAEMRQSDGKFRTAYDRLDRALASDAQPGQEQEC